MHGGDLPGPPGPSRAIETLTLLPLIPENGGEPRAPVSSEGISRVHDTDGDVDRPEVGPSSAQAEPPGVTIHRRIRAKRPPTEAEMPPAKRPGEFTRFWEPILDPPGGFGAEGLSQREVSFIEHRLVAAYPWRAHLPRWQVPMPPSLDPPTPGGG